MAAQSYRWLRSFVGVVMVLGLLLVAQQAFAQGTPQVREIELVGQIQAVDQVANTITVNDLIVDLAAAEVKTPLTVGLAVRVHGILLDDGTIQASEVDAAEAGILPGEFELIDTLDSVNGDLMVISGLEFNIASAEVQAGLVPGDLVKVHATLAADGTRVAREVERFTPEAAGDNSGDSSGGDSAGDGSGDDSSGDSSPAAENEFEITGTLDQIGDGFLVVAGQTIDITQAEIKNALVVGALVKVHVSVVDGALVAREVENASQGGSQSSGDSGGGSGDDSSGHSGDDSSGDSSGSGHEDSSSGSGACLFKVENSSVNLRSGPGTGYDILGYGLEGDQYPVTGIHESGDWLIVEHPAVGTAWVAASVGELKGDCSGVPVSNVPVIGQSDSGDDGEHHSSDSAGEDHSSEGESHSSESESSSSEGESHSSESESSRGGDQ